MRYLFFFISSLVFASDLSFPTKPINTVTASGVEIPIFSSALYAPNTKLVLTGQGVREKSILIASVNVYHAASYLDQRSLEKSKVRLLSLTFLRDLASEKIRSSFSDALRENGIALDTPEMQSLFQLMTFDVKKGSKVNFIGLRGEKSETILFELPDKTLKAEGPSIVQDFWKIWFGKPADSGLKDLKEQLESGLKTTAKDFR